MSEEIETKIAALSIIAAPYAALSGTLREEFPSALDARYGLTEGQKAWCAELLDDPQNLHRNLYTIDQATGGISPGEYQFLWDLIDWFLDGVEPKERLLEEIGSQGYVPEDQSRIFPEEVLEAFKLIEMAPTFDDSVVTSAFRKSMGLIHPDPVKAAGLSSDEVQDAGELSVRVIRARLKIRDFYQSLKGVVNE